MTVRMKLRASASIRAVTHMWPAFPKNRRVCVPPPLQGNEILLEVQTTSGTLPAANAVGSTGSLCGSITHNRLNSLQRGDFLYISKSTLFKIQMKVPLLLLTLSLFSLLCRKNSNFSKGTLDVNPS